ncbi:hypothetical protein TWF191_005081 [Orbilia oligospora]|uniref:Uncharacterized protein n=1 Tax=Orbilia oligospora TaxID=2813651 RepID=A0A7C8UQY5_ORBOL|nr:hypothetical protein TWF191_005081 [Orbilia oligospora]
MLLHRIESVITEVQSEASTVLHQQMARGRGVEAHFLAELLDRKDWYAETAIVSDYQIPSRSSTAGTYKQVNKTLLDRSAGLLFRWFRGITANTVKHIAFSWPITEEEATRFYATLKTVSKRCRDGLNPQVIQDSLLVCGHYRCPLDLDDIFVRIGPPLLRYLRKWNDMKELALESNWIKGLSNLINGGNTVGILDSMTLRQESLIQLMLQGQGDEEMLHSVEKAVASGLRPAAFHLPYCLGEVPSLIKNNFRITELCETILAPIAGVHVNVSRQDILHAKLISYQEIKHFDDVQMTPLMYALYKRRYSVIYAILTSKNPDWVFQTSNTALFDIAVLPLRTERLFGPVHVAAWTYWPCTARRDCHTYFDMTEIFSKLCQDANQLASAIEIAIIMQNKSFAALLGRLASIMILSQSQDGVAYDTLTSVLQKESWHPWYWETAEWFISHTSLERTLENAQRDVASLTQPPRAGETIGRSGDAGEEPDISDREHNDGGIGYESQSVLASTGDNEYHAQGRSQKRNLEQERWNFRIRHGEFEGFNEAANEGDNGNRNSANTKASQQKQHETKDEKNGYVSAQDGRPPVNRQHKPIRDFGTLDESKQYNDRQTRSSIGSNPIHQKNHIPAWGAQQRQWKVPGGKLSNGSGIMSLASKASASTASSGLSVISFGGMPFTQPRGRGLNFEKPAFEEEPEFMDIDDILTWPP